MKAILIIDEMEIPLLLYSLAFSQGCDVIGRPSQKPIFKRLIATIESRKNVNFYEWMLARNVSKNFKIHIHPTILGGRIRKLLFFMRIWSTIKIIFLLQVTILFQKD